MVAKKRLRVWDGTAILVADPANGHVPIHEFDRRIDQPLLNTVEAIHTALERSCKRVLRFSDLSKLAAEIGKHPDSIVFPYWFGQHSRSRHGLVPAICEAADVMFVGADAYAKVICNDKELSKVICRQANLTVPVSAVLSSLEDIQYASYVPLPVVVKPNYEGTSLGITQKNLCGRWSEVSEVAEEIFRKLEQPVIIEEFISGREFSACLLGNQYRDIEINIGAWKINGDSSYLDNRLNTFDLKLPSAHRFEFESLNSLFSPKTLTAFRDCFRKLGKTELLRIDGRLNPNHGVVILELTPDIYLGSDGEFCSALGFSEDTYADFISCLLANCLEGYEASVPVC